MGVHSETPSEAEKAVSRVGLEPTTYGLKVSKGEFSGVGQNCLT